MPGGSINRRLKRKGYASRVTRYVSKRAKKALVARMGRRASKFSLNTHRFSRWSNELSTIQCSGTSLAGALQFTMDQVVNYTEFSNLFDQFKITKVIVQLQLITNPDAAYNTNGVGPNQTANWFPKFWYIRDYDGGSTDTLTEIKERQGVRCFVLRPNKIYRIAITPKIAVQTYRTATTTGYAPKAMSLDFASGYDVPHYGLHYVVDALGLDPNDSFPFLIKREYKFYFTCKDVR